MKNNIINKISRSLFGSLLLITIVAQAHAGPGPREVYTPIKTMEQAKQLKPGEKIAFKCACGAVTTMVVGKDGNYPENFTCPVCKKTFVVHTSGAHGIALGSFVYEDDQGDRGTLLRAE
jgi:hypothetical protein